MKLLNSLIFFFAAFLMMAQNKNLKRESVLDSIVHIEDSIHYSVPILPRLCDYMDSEKGFINIGNCNLFVEMEGEGVPVVLVNGGPGGTHHYFHPWFSRLKNSHRIIYYDQRGTGLSDFNPGSGYSFRQAVDDLEKLRTHLGIQRWVVCGFSYGGGLAQFYAATYPEHVMGLVLISSLPLSESDLFEDEQQKYISKQEQKKRETLIKEFVNNNLSLEAFLFNLALNGDWKRQNFYKPTQAEMVRSARYEWINDTDFNSVMSEDYRRYNLRGVFDTCPVPTAIFEGNNDLTWGPRKAFVVKKNHPNARFFVFEKAAHGLFKDVPDEFFSCFTEFTEAIQSIQAVQVMEWKKKIADRLNPRSSE